MIKTVNATANQVSSQACFKINPFSGANRMAISVLIHFMGQVESRSRNSYLLAWIGANYMAIPVIFL
jgi:hypothetical protein